MKKTREFKDPLTFPCNDCLDRETPKCIDCSRMNAFIAGEPTTFASKERTLTDQGIITPIVQPTESIFNSNAATAVRHPDKRKLRQQAKESGALDELSPRQRQVFISACDTVVEPTEKEIAKALDVATKTVQRDTKYISIKVTENMTKKK